MESSLHFMWECEPLQYRCLDVGWLCLSDISTPLFCCQSWPLNNSSFDDGGQAHSETTVHKVGYSHVRFLRSGNGYAEKVAWLYCGIRNGVVQLPIHIFFPSEICIHLGARGDGPRACPPRPLCSCVSSSCSLWGTEANQLFAGRVSVERDRKSVV